MVLHDEYSWYWYAYKDAPIQLDPDVYPSLERIDGRFPIPGWVCVGPNKSLHLKYDLWNDLNSIDVHLKSVPRKGKQFCRTQYGVSLLEVNWMKTYIEMIPANSYRLSQVLHNGATVPEWVAVTTRNMPRLRSVTEIIIPACPTCGTPERYKPISSRCWLDSRDKSSDIIFSTWDGFFLRSDVADHRGVASPKGAFKYISRVIFK